MHGISGLITTLAAAIACALPVCGRAEPYPGLAPLFTDHSPLRVTIDAPLTALMDVRPEEAWLNGTFAFTDADGNMHKVGLKLRTRGNYRRDKEHCSFAPIRLNLPEDKLAGTIFEGQDKLKLVTHCRNNDPVYENLVIREYLAYRLLHELTPKSFAVRLLKITYIDTEDDKERTRFGFVIEEDDDVAKRNSMKIAKVGLITNKYLEPEQASLVHVFEYMIGNTEYSVLRPEPNKDCCHNAKLMAPKGATLYTPIAYDFDFSGLVNAPYAEPNPRYKLPNVRVRQFRGSCRYDEHLEATVQYFHERKDALYRVIDDVEPMTRLTRSAVTRYVDAFYDRIETRADIEKHLIDKCYKTE